MLKGPGNEVEAVRGCELQLRLGKYLRPAILILFIPLDNALIAAFDVSLRAWSVVAVEYTGF